MKRFLILSAVVFAMFFVVSCGGSDSNSDNNGNDESGFKAVDVGECRLAEPPLSFRDRNQRREISGQNLVPLQGDPREIAFRPADHRGQS